MVMGMEISWRERNAAMGTNGAFVPKGNGACKSAARSQIAIIIDHSLDWETQLWGSLVQADLIVSMRAPKVKDYQHQPHDIRHSLVPMAGGRPSRNWVRWGLGS
uniref:Uncharacterized protein n=1 Tax=Coccidioides posadasii RMSCC 3488 TaxID=454284 RepID=A0A0J6FS20_COCPO|nr:hypothetical protein CPAG_09453 [Coccidioides posadasii RMSCC 3488]